MSNLDLWIKAQFKKGKSIKQIKLNLKKHGYPQSELSKVDFINRYNVNSKTSSFKFFVVSTIIIGLIVIWVITQPLPTQQQETQVIPYPEDRLKPISMVSADDGTRIAMFSGTVSEISSEIITLTFNGRTSSFLLSQNPNIVYEAAIDSNTNGTVYEINAGDKVDVYLKIGSSEQIYVHLIVINELV
jgi:hypothetical protein